jgi:hypothetical protein
MKKTFRDRYWVVVMSASLSGLLALTTLLWPEWVEIVVDWGPDQHNGSVEWMIVAMALLVAVMLSAIAVGEWRRTPVAQS